MRRSWKPLQAIGAAALCAAAACGGDGAGGPDAGVEKEVLVAHFVSECTGVGSQTCLNVRESEDAEWTLWYDGIEGFEHEAGYDYRLLVRETTVEDPPADASSVRWTLVAILEKTPVSAGAPGEDPILRPWKLESFGPAGDLGDAVSKARVVEALAALPADHPVRVGLREEGRGGGVYGGRRALGEVV